MCSTAIVETSFSFDKDIWIGATDLYALLHNYFIFIVILFPLTAFLQLIDFAASYFLVY